MIPNTNPIQILSVTQKVTKYTIKHSMSIFNNHCLKRFVCTLYEADPLYAKARLTQARQV